MFLFFSFYCLRYRPSPCFRHFVICVFFLRGETSLFSHSCLYFLLQKRHVRWLPLPINTCVMVPSCNGGPAFLPPFESSSRGNSLSSFYFVIFFLTDETLILSRYLEAAKILLIFQLDVTWFPPHWFVLSVEISVLYTFVCLFNIVVLREEIRLCSSLSAFLIFFF